MNTRAKGQRTFAKAMQYARATWPRATLMPIYQVSRWSQSQPCDLIVLDFDTPARLVEVRTNKWRIDVSQTRALAHLPGQILKEIWLFRRGDTVPTIRQWNGTQWERQTHTGG